MIRSFLVLFASAGIAAVPSTGQGQCPAEESNEQLYRFFKHFLKPTVTNRVHPNAAKKA